MDKQFQVLKLRVDNDAPQWVFIAHGARMDAEQSEWFKETIERRGGRVLILEIPE